jgi:energy-coupling factor transporter ATP-binding protein EcfA2
MSADRAEGCRVLKRVELENFKAFERLTATFGPSTFVVGPNNAGKSTLLSALRLASGLLRQTSRLRPDRGVRFRSSQYLGYSFDAERLGLVEENLRHEFREVETSIHVLFDNGAHLRAVWPVGLDEDDEPASPFFFVEVDNRPQPRTPAAVRGVFPSLGVVPMLAPIERTETLLETKTVKRDLGGRLSSRHFRNELHLMSDEELDGYRQMVRRWAPEIELRSLEVRMAPGGAQLDLFYEDESHRVPKEVCWAGDGMQVWLQVLYHIHRLRDADVLILDEPDIYLHADLQRRLVQILEEMDAQTILASHSPEVLGEAHTENVLWVDKSRRRAVRGSDGLAFSAEAIGSQFNVRIARALRSSVALFVEGKDMKIIRSLARTAGAEGIANESGLAVVPLDGFSNRSNVTPFKILVDEFLEGSVRSFVILDRDYRSDAVCRSIVAEFERIGIGCHIWKRKEIESYLLVPSLLARVSGLDHGDTSALLHDVVESFRGKVFARALAAAEEERAGPTTHRVNVIEEFEPRFAASWADPALRMALVPPKEVMSQFNAAAVASGGRPVSAAKLAKAARVSEIDSEVASVFDRIEELLSRK